MSVDYQIRVAFSRSPIVGDAIRIFTGGDVNHALMLHYDPVYDTTIALGANSNGFTPQRLKDFGDQIVRAYASNIDLLAGLRRAVSEGMLDEKYDFAGLFGMAVVEAEERIAKRIIANPALDRHKIFCSEAVTQIIRWSGFEILPGLPAGSIDPYRLDRAIAARPDKFHLVATV